MTVIRKIAVLTSGGDAPGMNAAIRAVVRTGVDHGLEVFGVADGYSGLVYNNMRSMTARDVGGIVQLGGTMLGSARCMEFHTEDGRRKAIRNLNQRGIDALVVIGGNGSQTGCHALHEMGYPVVGVASTIDNDLFGSDITIGVDTALNVALDCIDMLKVTASSHRRAFIVEVMGRDCGYLAATVGVAGGAEVICVPEQPITPEAVAAGVRDAYARGKTHALVVVAEGAAQNADTLAQYFKAHASGLGFDMRVCKLGHVQRGGAPGVSDRMLATRLGVGAVQQLCRGQHGVLIGLVGGQIQATPLAEIANRTKPVDLELLALAQTLAR